VRLLASVRSRATLAAVAVVGCAFVLGAIGLLGLLGASLRHDVELSARSQLNNVVALASEGEVPNPLPVSRDDTFTQIVSASGKVLASSPGLVGSKPLVADLRPETGATVVHQVPSVPDPDKGTDPEHLDTDGPYLVIATTVPTIPNPRKGEADLGQAGPLTVIVAASLASVTTASTTVAFALAGGLPVLTALVGALVWVFCGRALRPVEAIRAEVADISERDLHRRVPEPPALDEVGRLARTMNAMLKRLEDGAIRQRRFVADASHELRSPLTTIQAMLEVALAHPRKTSWPDIATEALDESHRLQRLIEDLLVLASADEEAMVLRMDLVDLDQVVAAEVGRARVKFEGLRFDLRRVSAGQVVGDRAQLARALQNLLDNAQRHANSVIGVELSTDRDTVTLVVADDGPGLAASDRERVFERFTRLDEARSVDEGGSGLGLAIVREIIRLHAGTVEMVDAEMGARCLITLPAACTD
jgi:signal transduction histidine kinase